MVPKTIANEFVVHELLGKGGFGFVYSASHVKQPTKKKYAVKFERTIRSNGTPNKHPQLYYEYRTYRHLNKRLKTKVIPKIYMFTQSLDANQSPINVLVMERIGANVAKIFSSHNKSFSSSNVVALGIQMIECVRAVHQCNIIHRDIKPENFCVGNDPDQLLIVDFGLSKCYLRKDGTHIPFITGKSLNGTPRYASIHCHEGIEQSRRDDLESLMYVLIFLFKGRLPWQGLKHRAKDQKHCTSKDQILRKKRKITAEELCDGMHSNFAEALNYVRNLSFEQKPNYNCIKQWLVDSVLSA